MISCLLDGLNKGFVRLGHNSNRGLGKVEVKEDKNPKKKMKFPGQKKKQKKKKVVKKKHKKKTKKKKKKQVETETVIEE